MSEENPNAAIEKRIKAFYVWYLTGSIADPQFPKAPKDRQHLRRDLTDSLAMGLKRIREDTGSDPLLCAQDFFGEWIGAIEVKITGQAKALVTFGPPPAKLHRILLTLRQEDSKWKIAKVEHYLEPPTR